MVEQPFEVLFCDLCNTSVPLQDVERGAAVRVGDKTVGACCVQRIRPVEAPRAAPSGETRLLPVALMLLAAVAAATIFLDHRLVEETQALRTERAPLTQAVEAQGNRLITLTESMDASATRDQVAMVVDRLETGENTLREFQAAAALGSDRLQAAVEALHRRVDQVVAAIPDHRPALEQLRTELRQQAVTLAELKAMPRQPVPVAPPPAEPVPATSSPAGMAPALAHHVQRLADPDPATRFEAVDELLRSREPSVREHLLPLAKDPDTFVRRLVVEGLREFRHASAVEALLTALGDPEEIVRDTAWRSLKELTGQKLPFEATASRDARGRAQARWQEWWDKNKASFGSS